MPIVEAIRLALSQLRAQKLKSALTLLGIVISVTFLITVVSIIEGVNVFVKESLSSVMAANTFDLRRGAMMRIGEAAEEERDAWWRRPNLRNTDVPLVVEALPPGSRWTAYMDGEAKITSSFSTPIWTRVAAVDGDPFGIDHTKIDRGRAISHQEFVMGVPSVVIGFEIADRLFGMLDPVDRSVRINGVPYRVVGVVEKRGAMFGESMDRMIYIPLSSPGRHALWTWDKNGGNEIDGIRIETPDPIALETAKDNVRQVMRVRHRLRPSQRDDFTLETSEAAMNEWQSIRSKLIAAAAILPGIGLVIGALVIMNIMLVAVAERTREIGIRKALGARRWDILSQFLVEAATISTIGAALGIVGGIVAAKIIASVSPLPAAVALWSIPSGLLLGAAVGIFAGMYPASRAARLDPIAALRFET